MENIAIVVHGGAGPDSEYIKQNIEGYKQGLKDAINIGYSILESGGSSIDAVEAAVRSFENNPHFNAGKGSSLNEMAEVEMCSSIMEGSTLKSGAVAIVKGVKNPVSLAKAVMQQTKHIYIGETGAQKFADEISAEREPSSYFMAEHNTTEYKKIKEEEKEEAEKEKKDRPMHGTVGAVAIDVNGNIAAATSTGGTEMNKQGRIGDSSMIGAGTYANNSTCGCSATGDGELNIQFVTCFHISALMEYKGLSVKEACKYLIHEKAKDVEGDMGVIAIDKEGNIAAEYSSERMHRGWKSTKEELQVMIYES
jgi:beta-aspartyl-peptidase (threonine type)